ncbi:hypothetical protein FNV43_RR02600 [Rhamnella rubrinervis]|uniref:Transposase (putative) gypsy type domain-containing protein n=1 Tax=Rhamnella rubrinervis TaxID=2594499 RepID=A0A8K0MTU0_9ROSA|nr:hypothetical protein FNV43_RR02600 [Rhamnella rubrinervis]
MSEPSIQVEAPSPLIVLCVFVFSGDIPYSGEYSRSDPSPDSTPLLSSASSSVRVVESDQVVEKSLSPYAERNVRRDDPEEHRPKFFIQYLVLMKTDIPSIFKPEDMSYPKEKYSFPSNAMLSAPREGKKADSVRNGWICFNEITFKLGLRLPFHHIINMVLNYFNLAHRQLIPNGWCYLLGLIVLPERCGQPINMSTFLHFLYLKLSEEGSTALNLSAKLSTTTEQNNRIDILCSTREKSLNLLLSEESFHSVGYWPSEQRSREVSPLNPETEPIPKGIPLPILEDSDPVTNMENMKVRVPIGTELAEKKIRKKEKKGAQKTSLATINKELEPTPGNTILIQKKQPFTSRVEKSPLRKKQRQLSAPPANKNKGIAPRPQKPLRKAWCSRIALPFVSTPSSRSTLELRKDEGDNEPSEISSGEDELESDTEGEQNADNLSKDPLSAPEMIASPTRDSFIEAMQAVRSKRARPSTNAEGVISAAKPNQKELH